MLDYAVSEIHTFLSSLVQQFQQYPNKREGSLSDPFTPNFQKGTCQPSKLCSFPSLFLSSCTVDTEHANTSSLHPYLDPNRMVLAQPLLDSTKMTIASSSVTTTTLPDSWMSCSTYHQQEEEDDNKNKNKNKRLMGSPELSSSLSWIHQKDKEKESCHHLQEIREQQQQPPSSSSLQQ